MKAVAIIFLFVLSLSLVVAQPALESSSRVIAEITGPQTFSTNPIAGYRSQFPPQEYGIKVIGDVNFDGYNDIAVGQIPLPNNGGPQTFRRVKFW
jgi:hypothetical protein